MARPDIVNLTISEAAAQVERRTLSPVELTEAMLQRIAAVDKVLSAYITVCGEQAREVAQATEKMIGAGYHLGPLHGIPIAIKDNIYTRGVRTTAGSKILADFIPAEDATVTARLKRAGAVIIGKTNLHEFASNHNVVPLAWAMDTVSPMTRTVEDCVLMFEVIAGHDPLDDHSAHVPVSDYRSELTRGVRGLRVGLIRDYSLAHVQPAVGDTIRAAVTTLESLGVQVEEIAMPSIHGNISAQLTIESCEPSTYHQEWLRTRAAEYGEDVRTLLELGEMYLATHYLQAQRYRSVLRKEFLEGFKHVDAFVTPTLPFTPTPCGATEVVIENGQREDMLSAIMQFTGVPSLAGLPALSIPVGFDTDGLPVGMQVIGRPFDEGTLFRLGHAYQGATSWHTRAPRL